VLTSVSPAPETTVEITNFTTVSSTKIFLQWMVTNSSELNVNTTSYEVVYTYTDQDGEVMRSNISVNTSVTDVTVSIFVVQMC